MKFAVAPMIDFTDKHCRYLYRIISQHAWLFTEMITANAILFGDKDRLLAYEDSSGKTALQIAGNVPSELAQCAKIGEQYGYPHINLNVGCPSDRVQSGCFGAVLMKSPQLVADCIKAMQDASSSTISIKHRTGIDEQDSYEELVNFVGTVADVGCTDFIIHARKAWLQGLSPKENRTIPPLNYQMVTRLKEDFPQLNIIINGGFTTHQECQDILPRVDGVMVGRGVYHHAYFLAAVDTLYYENSNTALTRAEIVEQYISYMQEQATRGVPIRAMTKHILSLYYAQPNSKEFKRLLSGKTVELNALKDYMMERA